MVQNTDSQVQKAILNEQKRQLEGMELIASENYQSEAVLQAQSSVFANKYSEGFPGKRYYGGQENTDIVEQLAIDRAKQIFHADHANVQALSGAAANICVYAALMEPGDTILGMDLSHGGHLTHGAPVTFLSKVFNFISYKTLENGEIDFDEIRRLARKHKPKIILAGFSAYPRELDYSKFVEIANEVGAIAFADMSHIGGFIAAGILKNPLDYGFHVMMTTTHKSLRGPRGSLILSKGVVSNPLKKPENTIENIPTRIDRAVFPGIQGGPHMNTIAAIAVALGEAQTDKFKEYAIQALKNSKVMAEEFINRGYKLVTGGTDNHMVILDFSNTPIENGKNAEYILDLVGISTSKSTIPDDPNPPFRPSGLRIGTPAMTTRGVKEDDIRIIVDFIDQTLKLIPFMQEKNFSEKINKLKSQVIEFSKQFPVPRIN
ncbi:MAG: serine hydroxymethyltransferase [Candidatus Absconditabacterales bacterium]|nr:serine hydroxymethyltransferase [Candidatus Absconditabacterales bacterium]